MGVNTCITLPYSASARNIAQVMGKLAGLRDAEDSYNLPTGASIKSSSDVCFDGSYVMLHLDAEEGYTLTDGTKTHYTLLFMESTTDAGKMMIPNSTAFWIAMGRALVDFFGGSILYADFSSHTVDYSRPARDNTTEGRGDDSNFYAMKERIVAVKPLTRRDIEACTKYGSYYDEIMGDIKLASELEVVGAY